MPNNTHFDTTRANIEATGAKAVDLPCAEARDLATPALSRQHRPRRPDTGPRRERVPFVMVTVTNNGGGGQPVSIYARPRSSAGRTGSLLPRCSRFAENAWFIHEREVRDGARPS
ncbi:MAG: beta-eliminating lyase-related protein [Thermoanaerobaculia bacterium]